MLGTIEVSKLALLFSGTDSGLLRRQKATIEIELGVQLDKENENSDKNLSHTAAD